LDIPPGGGSMPHRHPGHHIFGYVLEGAYKFKVDDGPEKTLTQGETFYEAPGQLHAVSRNASETAPAKVLVVILAEYRRNRSAILCRAQRSRRKAQYPRRALAPG